MVLNMVLGIAVSVSRWKESNLHDITELTMQLNPFGIVDVFKSNFKHRRAKCWRKEDTVRDVTVHQFMLNRCHCQPQPAPLHRASPWIKEWQKRKQINKRAGRNSGKKGDTHSPAKSAKKAGRKCSRQFKQPKQQRDRWVSYKKWTTRLAKRACENHDVSRHLVTWLTP